MKSWAGSRSLPLRQATFFAVVIALPCVVIAALAARMLLQDRELTASRLAAEERRFVSDARQALLGSVERLRVIATADARVSGPPPPELAMVAQLRGRDFALPWEDQSVEGRAAARRSERRFRAATFRGEQLESVQNNPSAAAEFYLRFGRNALTPDHRAAAMLRAARAFSTDARAADAAAAARLALETSPLIADDEGIPFVLYASRLLLQSPAIADRDRQRVVQVLGDVMASPRLNAAAAYMVRDIARELVDAPFARAIDARVRDLEQTVSLRADLAALGVAVTEDRHSSWVPYGPADNLWLIGTTAMAGHREVIALRAAPLFEAVHAATAVTLTASEDGESLAPGFSGIRAVVSPGALAGAAAESRRRRSFYLTAMLLVIGVSILSAVLLWRDVRRELQVAQLRALFVSSVSHELRTPLTAIKMFADTLLMGRAAPDAQREYLRIIVSESERLTRLLNNLLDFSTIEARQTVYRLRPQSLADVVRAAANSMTYGLAQQGFELRVSIADGLPVVAIDPDAIQQAVVNLLSNAAKYSGDSRIVELEVAIAREHVVVAVTDRGLGIAAAEQARIFEKYYRVRDGSTDRIAGTGLGLTLVEHIARGHGGCVTVRSRLGEGSRFAMEIPLVAAPTPVGHA